MSFSTSLLSYQDFRKRQRANPLWQSEIPTEHSVSLPLPTLRWRTPAYISFASPAVRRPGQPMRQGAPDRWWVQDARNGTLIIYALWQFQAYDQHVQWDWVTLPAVTQSIEAVRERSASIELLMDEAARSFFAQEMGEQSTKTALLELLNAHIPQPLQSRYRVFAPDFWTWLSQ